MRDTRAVDRLMTLPELAEFLGVPPTTLYAWRQKRTGPRASRVGKHLRYRRSDVEKWLDAQAEMAA